MSNKIKLFEVKSEIGAGTRGASLGIDAIKEVAFRTNQNFYSSFDVIEIATYNNLLTELVKTPHAKWIKAIFKICRNLSEEISKILTRNKFPVILSGDHSTAGGSISGIKTAYPNSRIGVVWIDAHPDLHSPYTTPSGNVHGMPLNIVLNEDNLPCKVNELDERTIRYWNLIKNIGDVAPKIFYPDIVFIAIRDIDHAEKHLINQHQIKTFSINDIRAYGDIEIAEATLSYLSGCDYIYVSFDVDSLDTSVSAGTGTPVENGIYLHEAKKIINTLLQDKKTCCLEITEVNPQLDKEKPMADVAFEILHKAVDTIEKRFIQ